ncbi:MAG: DUF2835 domain-containing protein [Kangiellaceae bacterium]|nr:DUF2835 domain-containing protein [Kangiellaceae bacterium]
MPLARFSINLNTSEVQKYYRGQAQNILVRSYEGLKVQFPANLILPYVSRSGVQGEFILEYDNNGKVISLIRK